MLSKSGLCNKVCLDIIFAYPILLLPPKNCLTLVFIFCIAIIVKIEFIGIKEACKTR